jgi:DDE_Tnp_1-associated
MKKKSFACRIEKNETRQGKLSLDSTTWTLPTQTSMEAEDKATRTLQEAFQGLADPRREPGKRYQLALILSLLVLAKLAGQPTLSAATEWIGHRRQILAQRFRLSREQMRCQTSYSNGFNRVDANECDALVSAWLIRWEAQSRCGNEPSRLQTPGGRADHRHWAIDGKTLRATSSQPQPIQQLRRLVKWERGSSCGIARWARRRMRSARSRR